MNWFDKLEKWQKGGIIGGAIGLRIALTILTLIIIAELTSMSGNPLGWVRWAYLFHFWPLYWCVFDMSDISSLMFDPYLLASLLFLLVLFYILLGFIWGWIRQIKAVETRSLVTALYIAFLSICFVTNASVSLMTAVGP